MANWCSATEIYGTADKLGTPGTTNLVCPIPGPCDPNPCDASPADICNEDGLNLNDYPELGSCSNENGEAVCAYEAVVINCADSDQKCEGGQCVSICDPNPCDNPPADECDVDGLNLSDYPELGECTVDNGQAACDYQAAIVNCADSDQKCEDGMCVSACDPNPCDNPPANVCDEDGVTLTAYPIAGDCTAIAGVPSCDYPAATVDCSVAGAVCTDGECIDPDQPVAPSEEGDLVLTEFMAKSMAGTDKGEWVEFYNNTDSALNLQGCFLRDDDNDSFEIVDELVVESGAYILFARSDVAEENHGLPLPSLVYTGFQLSNSSDEIALQCGELVVDHIAYTGDWVTEFAATQLPPANFDITLNNDLANWCVATTEYGTAAKLGTPGTANIACQQ